MNRLASEAVLASGESVRTALTKAENSIDQAIADIGTLTTAISTERLRLGIAFQFGQDAIARGAEGLALLAASRAKIAETHNELGRTGKMLGIPAHALDGLWGKPPAKARALHAVESEAA